MTDIWSRVTDTIHATPKAKIKPTPRRATQDDIDGWLVASNEQKAPMTRAEILRALNEKNSYRMWRIRMDHKWMRRQLKKMGLNPDDARELL